MHCCDRAFFLRRKRIDRSRKRERCRALRCGECDGAVGFPLIFSDAKTVAKLHAAITDLDLSIVTDTELCGDDVFNQAEEIVRNALIDAGFLKEEFQAFAHEKTMFTGSASEPPGCYELTISDKRTICGLPVGRWSESGISATWDAKTGELKKATGTGGGFVDYAHPITACATTLWTLETCGGIFSYGEYLFTLDGSLSQALKSMYAICEDTYAYAIPVCDDVYTKFQGLSDLQLCGTNFCMPQNPDGGMDAGDER